MVALLQLCRAAMKFICTRFCYCRFASVSTTEPIRRLPSPFGSGKCAVVASVTSSSLCLIDPPMKLRQLEQFSSLYTIYFTLCIPFGRPVRVWRNAWKGFNGPYPKLQFNVAEWLTARRHLCWTTTNNFCLLLFFFSMGVEPSTASMHVTLQFLPPFLQQQWSNAARKVDTLCLSCTATLPLWGFIFQRDVCVVLYSACTWGTTFSGIVCMCVCICASPIGILRESGCGWRVASRSAVKQMNSEWQNITIRKQWWRDAVKVESLHPLTCTHTHTHT